MSVDVAVWYAHEYDSLTARSTGLNQVQYRRYVMSAWEPNIWSVYVVIDPRSGAWRIQTTNNHRRRMFVTDRSAGTLLRVREVGNETGSQPYVCVGAFAQGFRCASHVGLPEALPGTSLPVDIVLASFTFKEV